MTYQMSTEHKEQLAIGREQGRIVRDYLNALNRPTRRGRKRTVETVERQLQEVLDRFKQEEDQLNRLRLYAESERLRRELVSFDTSDLTEFEEKFVEIAADYSQRKGISYAAWRELGVPARVLREAGISRSRTLVA